jgi:Tol biopolymer transport system component
VCSGASFGAGDPARRWWTIETQHLRIHYPRRVEAIAKRIARLGEAIHSRLGGPLGYVPAEPTHIVLTDQTDSANGSATGIPFNTIRLYLTAPDDLSPLHDYDDWYLGLLTHEYTHILHIDNVSGIPALINTVLGKTLVPNQLQQRWLIEGLATVIESRFSSGGRIRSSLFDAYLRADVLDKRIARLDEISSNPMRWPNGNLWYLYGSRFLQWITDVYGFDVLRAVATDYGASLLPWGINRAIRRQTGRSYVQLYEGFKKHLKRTYARQIKAIRRRGLREGKRVTFHGRNVHYPRFVPPEARQTTTGIELVYFKDDSRSRPGHYRLHVNAKGKVKSQLIARTQLQGPVSFGPKGAMLFGGIVPYRRIYNRSELMLLPPAQTAPRGTESVRKQLTFGQRARAATVSPQGKIAYTVNRQGSTTLQMRDLRNNKLAGKSQILVQGRAFDQVYTPRFAPNGKSIAYSAWSAGGYRDVFVLDLATGKTTPVTHDRAIDSGPCWSPDGTRLYFSSDRSGIFNIYEYTIANKKLRQVTNVRVAALMPSIDPSGKTIAYVGYTSRGYDLYLMRLDPARYLSPAPIASGRPRPLGQPPAVSMRKRSFRSFQTLRPYAYSFEVAQSNFNSTALTLRALGQDVIGHHGFEAAVVADPGAPAPNVSLAYTYGRLPADIGVELAYRLSPRLYRFSNQELSYAERSYSVRPSISYLDLSEFGSQQLSLSYSYSLIDASLPSGSAQALDPYAPVTQSPFRGTMGFVRLGYYLSTTEGGLYAAGAARGWSLSLGLDIADKATGSSSSYYAGNYSLVGYIPMPWQGDHVLALRSSGGMSQGSFTRRGSYFVGGYNLENSSLIDDIGSGTFNGAFVLRGYEPNAASGRSFLLNNFEYRLPLHRPDRGLATLPFFLRRIDANLFFDWGGAFDKLNTSDFEFFTKGALVRSPQLLTGAGAEIWLGSSLAYYIDVQFRLGYAVGFSAQRIPGGRGYFIASSPF